MANVGQARPARIGVLDVGSNTVLLLVLDADGRVIRDAAHITRLGQGVFASGALAPDATLRTRAAIAELAALARTEGVVRVVAVGTEALRRARDGADFLARSCATVWWTPRGCSPARRRPQSPWRLHGFASAPRARHWP